MIPILRQDYLIEFADGVLKLHELEFQCFEASVCFAQVCLANVMARVNARVMARANARVVVRMVDDGLTQIGI